MLFAFRTKLCVSTAVLRLVLLLCQCSVALVPAVAQNAETANASLQRTLGSIKAVSENGISLTSDEGQEVLVTLQDSARILRVAPGAKDLKNAAPIQKQDLKVGDRILVRGKPGTDAHSIVAGAIIVMTQSDVAAKQEKDREDWQRRGVGGLVTALDPSSGTITISTTSLTGTKNIALHTTKSTILRRYAPNSVKFDDAKVAPLSEIKVGDQLRARGNKNAEGTEVATEEVVSGTFRNLAGQITGIDTAANTLTLNDAISKQTITVKIGNDAQLRKLPAEFAQRIAMRLKGAAAGGVPGAGAAASESSGGSAGGQRAQSQGAGPIPGGPGGGGRNGAMDVQQILNRMPPAGLSDLQKGDAVMIVSTQGDGSGSVTAITLLAGVEPILTAAPNAGQAMMLTPWTLGSGNAEAAANP
jgi:hypothetical protein